MKSSGSGELRQMIGRRNSHEALSRGLGVRGKGAAFEPPYPPRLMVPKKGSKLSVCRRTVSALCRGRGCNHSSTHPRGGPSLARAYWSQNSNARNGDGPPKATELDRHGGFNIRRGPQNRERAED